jgi:hypothetical protein
MLAWDPAIDIHLAAMQDKRHHPACPLHVTEKHPRLFYYEETENCWAPAPESIENIISVDLLDDCEAQDVTFKRVDMTDEEFYNLPED